MSEKNLYIIQETCSITALARLRRLDMAMLSLNVANIRKFRLDSVGFWFFIVFLQKIWEKNAFVPSYR
jgi:hypothetical protein